MYLPGMRVPARGVMSGARRADASAEESDKRSKNFMLMVYCNGKSKAWTLKVRKGIVVYA
jgi:hypothetical protein